MKRNSTKRVMAIALSAALALTSFTFGGNVTTVKAAGTSIDLVSSSESNKGDNTSYTYNKSGLVTKIVSKSSSKESASYDDDVETSNVAKDIATTTTTTYKYNKNNKVSQKTAKSVTTTKYYKMDESTGLTVKGNLGTITTTSTTVTEFTYDKKGNATQAVATSTTGKSGSVTYTNKSSIGGTQLSDGRIIWSYNDYDANGNWVGENTAATAIYLSNPSGVGEETTTTTVTYTDKGGGAYTKTTNSSTASTGYHTEWASQYYVRVNGTPVAVTWATKPYTDPDDGSTYDRTGYWDANGNYYDDYDFSYTSGVTAVADPADNRTSSSNNIDEITSKTVTTTKFTYDKKKRVKKAAATAVYTSGTVSTENSVSPYNNYYDSYTETGTRTSTYKRESAYESTSSWSTDYSYDKKGRAKKSVYSAPGVDNAKSTYSSFTVGSSTDYSRTYNDGRPAVTGKYESAQSNAATSSTTVTAGGVRTTTVTYNPYTRTSSSSSSAGTASTDTYSYYYNPTEKSWQQGTGAAYSEAGKPEAVTATPRKETTNYTYDGKSNLKSAKSSGTQVFEYTVRDETYGNTIYDFNAEGRVEAKKATTTNKFTGKDTYENTVKNKSNSMTEVVGLHDSTYNRSQDSGYSVSHRTFKLKAKKFGKTAKLVKKQQWIIQNGSLNGEIGLL